ncbi:uncharacterized protein LOC111074918 [Drosophila obscura]|uniref:uncharacterized protein LOC111074918 n=1 Tax=Drosophila obscura TaxID=7282 RepID=UPI001BB0DB81|nr:uncharacterized protein LOC111074918 [Drosophila obscura]XP_041448817.1 uncharacterized protein LOC111074918 [Drosophila obscura]
MTKSKKKKAAAAKNNSNNAIGAESVPPSILTPPGTPPKNGLKITNNYGNGTYRSSSVSWEREFIGLFLLEMGNSQKISGRNDWYVDKTQMRKLFEAHLGKCPNYVELRIKLSANGAYNIGSLMQRTNFLMNTPRGSSNYRIRSFSLMEFRREKFNAIDERQRLRDGVTITDPVSAMEGSLAGKIIEQYVLDTAATAMPLKYQKTQVMQSSTSFELNSMGCYICEDHFESIEKYEEHVEHHGDESDFKSLEKMTKFSSPMVTLSYQTCVDSHYFGFTLKTDLKDVVVQKFIIVQSRQFYYVYNGRMPLTMPENGEKVFFVDSHVFTILREMPIVIGFTSKGQRYVEQHHFMRTEALPKAMFNINPYRLSTKEIFRGKGLPRANPPTEVVLALKHDNAQKRLVEYDRDYRNYCAQGRELTQVNIGGALRTLLQVEDIERLQHYLGLKQSQVELHQFGRELSVKIKLPSVNNGSVEDILSPGDDVLIINERVNQGSPDSVRKLLENSNLVLELALKEFDGIIKWAKGVDEKFGSLPKQPRVYFARILGVSTQRVHITCERQLPDNTTYSLIFRPVRAVMRYQYRALEQLTLTNSQNVQRILFPGEITRMPVTRGALKLHDQRISGNPEQMQAVQQIAMCPKLPAPYIVFGPPGTGKTATICEAIYQLFVCRPETHILVLAGSNTACDEIALRLLRSIAKAPETQPRPLTRIFAACCDRRIDNIDDLLLEYSNLYAVHFYPAVQAVHQYRIVVCTLSLAGKLSTGGFAIDDNKQPVFSHVFVDEAAASTEAECLMGITCTISPTTNLILSGDHKQLGPVLQSHRANEWGLSVSLFERLLERKCYQVDAEGGYNAAVQTRLIRNFRSHPEIVSLYSDLYYNSELKAEASMENVSRVKSWFHTTNEDFPIMFHSVFGTVMNTKRSVSLCNNKEIDTVMDYVKDLMYFGINGKQVAQTDIGIISPYKNQYQRIQEQLNMRNWSQIDCGSVELFQGKEKQIIIVSFVRSFTPKLGFLDNQRRLNVLLSRPMSLLIMIGNPRTLSQNHDFRSIIELCRARRTLVGVPYFSDENGSKGVNGTPRESLENTQIRTATKNDTPTQASRLFYNKEELLKLGIESKAKVPPKSELDKLFDELPKVPRYVDHSSDAVRSVTTQIRKLQVENGTNVKAKLPSACPANSKPIPVKATPQAAAPAKITTTPVRAATANPSTPLSIPASSRASYAIDFNYYPTAPALSPPRTSTNLHRATVYSHIPTGSTRFENVRAPPEHNSYRNESPGPTIYSHIPTGSTRFENVRASSEHNSYRSQSHFNASHGPSYRGPRAEDPKPEKKKSTCTIS